MVPSGIQCFGNISLAPAKRKKYNYYELNKYASISALRKA
jgi:hypothetical protein